MVKGGHLHVIYMSPASSAQLALIEWNCVGAGPVPVFRELFTYADLCVHARTRDGTTTTATTMRQNYCRSRLFVKDVDVEEEDQEDKRPTERHWK